MRYFFYTLLLPAVLLFCIQTQAYCIYNYLEEGKFNIHDERGSSSAFRKSIENGAKECCHYSNKDCNPSQSKIDAISFVVRFVFPQAHPGLVYRAGCAAGGALAFYGTLSDLYAVCTPPNGHPSFRTRLMPH